MRSQVGAGSTFTLVAAAGAAGGSAGARRDAFAGSRAASTPRGPATVDAAGPRLVDDDRRNRSKPGAAILVVEDDALFARILYDLAHELDFDCVIATTTEEGMALARELSPIGVLLDIELPDGSGLYAPRPAEAQSGHAARAGSHHLGHRQHARPRSSSAPSVTR